MPGSHKKLIPPSPGGACRTPKTPKLSTPGAIPGSTLAFRPLTPSKLQTPLALSSSPTPSSPAPSSPPPYDPSTYDPLTFKPRDVPLHIRNEWCKDPIIYLSGNPPDPKRAKTAKEYVRRHWSYDASSEVLALGTNPYPELRNNRRLYIPELDKNTPSQEETHPWFGKSTLLAFVTPLELQKKGCINIDTSNGFFQPMSRQFRLNTGHAGTASKDESVMSMHGDHKGIHPCFRRSNWVKTSDHVYECLKPTLRVASKILEMPSLLDMWHALGSPLHKAPATKLKPNGSWVYYTGRSSEVERTNTASEIEQLSDYVTWVWKDRSGCSACTDVDGSKVGLRGLKSTFACNVYIARDFRYILCGGTAYAASRYNREAWDGSSLLRVQFQLALTLVHELTHVWFLNTTDISHDVFPYANDERIGEEGHACEAVITRSVNIKPIDANPPLDTSPFGMMADPWPGAFHGPGFDEYAKASRTKHGVNRNTQYAVPMKFIRDFFTDDFWEHREMRFGAGAVEGYKAIGVRLGLTFDPEDFDALESPTVEKTRDEDTGLDIDTWMPDVEEGIIYPDKALELSGEPYKHYYT